MDRLTLANRINSISTIKGQFCLRSGQTSNEYFDKYLFESHSDLLRAIAEQMATQIPKNIDALAGLELGGVPIATVIAVDRFADAVRAKVRQRIRHV